MNFERRQEAHGIGSHGLTAEEFKRSGLFEAAIESIRGTRSATMQEKRAFIDPALSYLRDARFISEWQAAPPKGVLIVDSGNRIPARRVSER
jgi:hypothetical protein